MDKSHLAAPKSAAIALLYPATASADVFSLSSPLRHLSIVGVKWEGAAMHKERKQNAAASLGAWQGWSNTDSSTSVSLRWESSTSVREAVPSRRNKAPEI